MLNFFFSSLKIYDSEAFKMHVVKLLPNYFEGRVIFVNSSMENESTFAFHPKVTVLENV